MVSSAFKVKIPLTGIQPLAPLRVRVPDEEVGGLVRDDGQEVAVLVPPETDAHPGQTDLVQDLGVAVVDVHNLRSFLLRTVRLCPVKKKRHFFT